MNRRQVLKTGACLGFPWIAGCGGLQEESSVSTHTPVPEPSPVSEPSPASESTADRVRTVAGEELPIPQADMSRVLPVNGILAIEEPAFDRDWSGLELTYTRGGEEKTIHPRLRDDDQIIGVEDETESRAYPLRVLNWHEIVNDTFEGHPLLITYCPLCGSGMTATRRVAGEETIFGVTGLLWKGNLVMFDHHTQSLWSQLSATGIHGPEWGKRLELQPSTFTTWKDWQEKNPNTRVLLPPPHSRTVLADLLDEHSIDRSNDYTTDPYALFRPSTEGHEEKEGEEEEHPFTLVIGVATDWKAVAYPLPAVRKSGLVNDTVGTRPVVVASSEPRTLVAYSRRIDSREHRFSRLDEAHMQAAGTTWRISNGEGVAGRYEGTQLERANSFEPLFLVSWKQYYPDTEVYTSE